jgi:hypothetical protein
LGLIEYGVEWQDAVAFSFVGRTAMLEITAALGGLKSSVDLIRLAVSARDESKALAAVADLQERLLGAYGAGLNAAQKASELESELQEARREIAKLQNELRQQRQLELFELVEGAVVYRQKPENGAPPSAFYFCQVCFDKGVRSILKPSFDRTLLLCGDAPAHNLRLIPHQRVEQGEWDTPANSDVAVPRKSVEDTFGDDLDALPCM